MLLEQLQHKKSYLQNEYLKSFSEIIQSEVFSCYLDMANHLLNECYKDSAAGLTGSTLDVELRELCISNNIAINPNIVNTKLELTDVGECPIIYKTIGGFRVCKSDVGDNNLQGKESFKLTKR